MNKKTKRSFVLKNFKVLFVKPEACAEGSSAPENDNKSDIVREAEEIIDTYLKKMGYNGVEAKPKRKKHTAFYSLVAVTGAISLIIMLVRLL